MYAIIRTGGKQYRVEPGKKLRVEKLENELGSKFTITEVLAVGGKETFVGAPLVDKAKVEVTVTQQARGPKVLVFKKKRRKRYRRMKGHRQSFTELFIESIQAPNGDTEKASAKASVIKKADGPKTKQTVEQKKEAKAKKTASKKVAKKKTAKKKTAKKKVAKKKAAKKKTKKATKKKS